MRPLTTLASIGLICCTAVIVVAQESSQELYKSSAGPYAVRTEDRMWKDSARDGRVVPVHVYIPEAKLGKDANEAAKFPVIIFSHGLGGAGTNYVYFGQHMASQGYLVLAPTHPGSDTEALKDWFKTHGGLRGGKGDEPKGDQAPGGGGGNNWLMSSINDPANLRNRPQDISFVIDHIATDGGLSSLADMGRIGVAGHSFGAYTAMAIGGMTIDLPEEKGKSFHDARVKCVLPMSPEGPGVMGITSNSWDKFATPVMFLTGTRDYGAGDRSADWRHAGFEHVRGVESYLVTLNGAGHMTFGVSPDENAGRGSKLREMVREHLRQRATGGKLAEGKDEDQPHHTVMIESLSTAFFDAYLRDDAAARDWLAKYAAAEHDDCRAEHKAGGEAKSEKSPK